MNWLRQLDNKQSPLRSRKRVAWRPKVEILEDRLTPAVANFVIPLGSSAYLDQAEAVATDDSGNIYATGFFNGAVDFDPGPGDQTITVDNQSAFVASYDSAGGFRWARALAPDPGQTAGTAGLFGHSIAVAGSSVYVVGTFTGAFDHDGNSGTAGITPASGGDIFITSLTTAAGNLNWTQVLGSTGADAGDDVAFGVRGDASGVYVTGYFSGTVDFDPGTGIGEVHELSSAGTAAGFALKLTTAGDFSWATEFTGADSEAVGDALALGSLTAGVASDVYIAGDFKAADPLTPGQFQLGAATYSAEAGFEPFVAKLAADTGAFQWGLNVPSDDAAGSGAYPVGIATDSANNIYLTGQFTGTSDFGAFSLQSTLFFDIIPTADIFVARITDDGGPTWEWAHGYGSDSLTEERGYGIEVDQYGIVVSTGRIAGLTDFGVDQLTPDGASSIYILQHDSDGNEVWAIHAGSSATSVNWGYGLAADDAGNLNLVGVFTQQVDFNLDDNLDAADPNASNDDGFLWQLGIYDRLPRFAISQYTRGLSGGGSGLAPQGVLQVLNAQTPISSPGASEPSGIDESLALEKESVNSPKPITGQELYPSRTGQWESQEHFNLTRNSRVFARFHEQRIDNIQPSTEEIEQFFAVFERILEANDLS